MTNEELMAEAQLIQTALRETLKAFDKTQTLTRFVSLVSLAGGVAAQAVMKADIEQRPLLVAEYAARLMALGELLMDLVRNQPATVAKNG